MTRLLLALMFTALVARVADADDAATRTAKLHFDRGEKLYALTKFSEALGEYQKAFDAKPIPDFLFNIGQCYRNLGDYDSAIFSYKKYLTLAPDAPNREQVEKLIGELQAKQDQSDSRHLGLQRRPEPAVPADDRPNERPDRPFYATWWFWTGIGAVAAGGGIGVYAATRPHGPPSTSLGNIVFGK